MTIDPAVAVRSFRMLTVCALGLMVSYAGSAAGASSTYCATHPDDRITTCFLDLTKTSPDVQPVNGGIFLTGASTPNSGDMGIRIQNGSVRLGDIAKVAVCDIRNLRDRRDWEDWRKGRCERYYDFLLDSNERADGMPLDEFKVLAGGASGTPSLRYDLDGGPGGDVSVVRNSLDGNDIRALIPVSSFAGLTDDTFVYVYSRFRPSGGCQEGSKGASCPPPGAIDPVALAAVPGIGGTQVPLPSTALLLGIGVVGVVLLRRRPRRSPA